MGDTDLILDLPNGPLDEYRSLATFNWKKLKLVFEDPELLKIKQKMWSTLEKDPLFQTPITIPTTEEMKKLTAKRLHKYLQYDFLKKDISVLPYKRKTRFMMTLNEALAISFPDVQVKHAVGVSLFKNAVSTLGTERHKHILDAAWKGKIVASLGLTEIAHGSNTKKLQTTATYDETTQEFIINTPNFQAAKCWIGNMGKQCTICLLFAQLITQGQNHGLHAFIVPIRDPTTLLPYPGIIVGDIGEKIGLHGIDNGFILFKNYRILRENMLNRTADVTPEGEYFSSFSEPGKILGAALENLSTGRVGIMQWCVGDLIKATTIAVRYAALRRQFTDNGNDEEYPIIEYQLHQWRLFPYVAAGAVLKVFVKCFTEDYLTAVEKSTTSDRLEEINNTVSEVHAIVSSAKPLITWCCLQAIQECREACGGHGFLHAARFGDLRSTNDPCVTFEGDNHVLGQQTSNWLLRQWAAIKQGEKASTPLGTCAFFEHHRNIINKKFNKVDVTSKSFIQECYEWLIIYLVEQTYSKQLVCEKNGDSKFMARNKTQVYLASTLTKVYCELTALRYFWNNLNEIHDQSIRKVLLQLSALYGLSNLDKHLVYFYEGGFCSGSEMAQSIRENILKLCLNLKDNIISIADALAPPDFVLNSVLGKADGKLYENLESAIFHNPNSMSRPSWWNEIIIQGGPDITKNVPKSKL